MLTVFWIATTLRAEVAALALQKAGFEYFLAYCKLFAQPARPGPEKDCLLELFFAILGFFGTFFVQFSIIESILEALGTLLMLKN
jgi:hypothetical protein